MVFYRYNLFLLTFLFALDSFGQASSITIAPLSIKDLLSCLVVISDGDGNVILENYLNNEEIINGTTLEYSYVKNGMIHFTVISELGDSLMAVDRLINAITYYNIDSNFKLTTINNPGDCAAMSPQPIQLIVDNAREVERVHYYFQPNRFKSFVRDRSLLKVNFSHQPEEDLFLVFECQTIPYDRYVYVPSQEIKKKLEFNLLNLPSELQERNVTLPGKKQWLGNITGTNLFTNSICRFYSSGNDPVRLDLLKILLPTDQIFEEFNIELGFEATDPYFIKRIFYTGLNKKSLIVPELNESLYNLYDFVVSDEGISCEISEEPDLLQLTLIQYNIDPTICPRSYWSIIAQNNNEFSFRFPKFSTHLLDACNVQEGKIGGWSVWNTALIKIIDKANATDTNLMIDYPDYDRITTNLQFR